MFNKLKKYLKEVWFDIDRIFYADFKLSLTYCSVSLFILDKGFSFEFQLNVLPFIWYNLWDSSSNVKNHKFWEHQLSYSLDLSTGFKVCWSIHRDHAGIESEFYVLGLQYYLNYIDHRHWDYDKNMFKIYD